MLKQGRHLVGGSPLYGYDITSAYPSKQYRLPAQALPIEWELRKDGSIGKVIKRIEGKWIWREGAELTEDIIRSMSVYSMIEVEFSFPGKCFDKQFGSLRDAPFCPLWYRCEDGSIQFPARGIGRYYRGEVLQAFDWVRRMRPDMNEGQHASEPLLQADCARRGMSNPRRGRDMIKLRGAWEFVCPTINDLSAKQLQAIRENCPSARIDEKTGLVYPFQYIKDYYDERAKYPKTDARNQILKLGINGSWGKTAQSVGGRSGMPPGSASPWYAGVVTSETRTQVMDAMLNAPWNIIHAATDGIQSNAPLGIESTKKTLGGWEMDTLTRGVYIKPGIYAFADDGEEPEEDTNPVDALIAERVSKKSKEPIFKGKSRGVGLRSVLGEDDDSGTKRNIQKEWFNYLDELAFDCYTEGRPLAILPHKKLVTFGLAASNSELWPMCGNWIEDTRIFKMNEAGVKRGVCIDRDRVEDLVITKVAINKTPKVLSARHTPEWLKLSEAEALIRDQHDNADLAVANDWDCCWDVGEDG
jgi:hypothetical protein